MVSCAHWITTIEHDNDKDHCAAPTSTDLESSV